MQEFDGASLSQTEWEIEEADDEITAKLKRRALLHKHLEQIGPNAKEAE